MVFGRDDDDILAFEKDYIKRQIQQLSRFIADRVLRARADGKYDQALEEIRRTARGRFGVDDDLLARVDAASAATLLRTRERISAYTNLLRAEADLLDLAGDAESAESRRKRAQAIEPDVIK